MFAKHFDWRETFRTDHRLLLADNEAYALEWQQNVIEHAKLMDMVRDALGCPVHVNSWVRCPALNTAVGGSQTSDHTPDEDRIGATDFTAPQFGAPYDVARALADPALGLPFRQLIYEHTWVHISSPRRSETAPRRQILTLAPGNRYVPGIVLKAGL